MGIFGSRGISRPTAAPPQVAVGTRAAYKGTSIDITNAVLPGGGDYFRTVSQHLDEISSFPVGQQLLQGLQASGKRVLITYGGANNNQAAGHITGYVVLRKAYDSMDRAAFGAELQRMITASGKTKSLLAGEIYRYVLSGWNGAAVANPFRSIPVGPHPVQPVLLPKPPGQPARISRPLPMTPVDAIVVKLDAWIGGTVQLPTKDEVDILLMVMEAQVQRGPGVGTRINYDPHKVATGGGQRPPQVALFHELTHAYYNAIGMQLGREDSMSEANGGRLFEAMAVGLGSFSLRPISENKFRTALGVGLRTTYP